jgi:hypothetical protein
MILLCLLLGLLGYYFLQHLLGGFARNELVRLPYQTYSYQQLEDGQIRVAAAEKDKELGYFNINIVDGKFVRSGQIICFEKCNDVEVIESWLLRVINGR